MIYILVFIVMNFSKVSKKMFVGEIEASHYYGILFII